MENLIANELKMLDVEIGKKIFTIAKDNGIKGTPSPLQARIIDYLIINKDKDISQKDLEEALNVSKVTISGAIKAMERNNIVKREVNAQDARSKKITLTTTSEKIHSEMSTVFSKLNEELTKGLSKEEIESFLKTIQKMKDNIKE